MMLEPAEKALFKVEEYYMQKCRLNLVNEEIEKLKGLYFYNESTL
jgi:hypothetical protein